VRNQQLKHGKHLVKELDLSKCEFNIIIVDNKRIHEINKEYRNVDRETDVISFAMEDNMDVTYKNFRLLGDIYISIDKCYQQAIEYGHSNVREICFLATHGILHLLGYDHMEKEEEERMFKLQEELLLGFDIKR
jgi:probable rRNA maturation factor